MNEMGAFRHYQFSLGIRERSNFAVQPHQAQTMMLLTPPLDALNLPSETQTFCGGICGMTPAINCGKTRRKPSFLLDAGDPNGKPKPQSVQRGRIIDLTWGHRG
jgi:hypothetical protein